MELSNEQQITFDKYRKKENIFLHYLLKKYDINFINN